MKKGALLFVLFVSILIVSMFYVSAELTEADKQDRINASYTCLENKINDTGCSRLTPEETIFSLLAVEKCGKEVIEGGSDFTCWPKGNCNIKTTAQAILALSEKVPHRNTTAAEEWLLAHKGVPSTLKWYLEIDTNEPSECKVYYEGSGSPYAFQIEEDKRLSAPTGTCFKPGYGGYFLEISKSCYNKEFTINCDKDFLTTLVYQKVGSELGTIYILKSSHSAPADGLTDEKINSYCFVSPGGGCDYEGSLWATLILDGKGYDVSSYLPYLMGSAEDNERFMPDAFIYFIGQFTDYKTRLLNKQHSGWYWLGDPLYPSKKYYDTATALFPFQYVSDLSQKQSTIDRLLRKPSEGGVYDDSGCWNGGNVRDNAFILYSIFPEYFSGHGEDFCGDGVCNGNETEESCPEDCIAVEPFCGDGVCNGNETSVTCPEDCGSEPSECIAEGFYCVNSCSGETQEGLDCPEDLTCCDTQSEESCEDLGGEKCLYGETCVGGTEIGANDLGTGETCCIEGTCKNNSNGGGGDEGEGNGTLLGCEDSGYYCTSFSDCSSGNFLSGYECAGLKVCCSQDSTEGQSCSDFGGNICKEGEYCTSGGIQTNDLFYGETCCLEGQCKSESSPGGNEYTCEDNGGTCIPYSCDNGYEESTEYSCMYGDKCCMQSEGVGSTIKEDTPTTKPKKGKAWVWIIFVLIVLGLVAVLFRDKIRMLIIKMKKSKKDTKKPRYGMGPRPGFPRPPITPRGPPRAMPPRRIIPSQQPRGAPPRRPMPVRKVPQKQKTPEELDDVLKKLKEMGK